MVAMIPYYLSKKFPLLGIASIDNLKKIGYLKVYQWLYDLDRSISHRVLFDLFSLCNDLPLNTINKEQQRLLIREYRSAMPCYLPHSQATIIHYLEVAQEEAQKALLCHEVPIGAVVVKDGTQIAQAHNSDIKYHKSTCHAELVAINLAQEKLGMARLLGCDLYVTIEPCLMCAGAIINSRIKRLIFGAVEPKTGAVVSQYQVFNNPQVNHHTEIIGPVNNYHYASLLQSFFRNKNNEQR